MFDKEITLDDLIDGLTRLSKGKPVDGLTHFCMEKWVEDMYNEGNEEKCGTVGCIAGLACAIAVERGIEKELYNPGSVASDVEEKAGELLGLDPFSRYDLFHGVWSSKTLDEIEIEEALSFLIFVRNRVGPYPTREEFVLLMKNFRTLSNMRKV